MGDALFVHGGVTSAVEARLGLAGLLALQGSGVDVRTGVLAGPGTTTLITGTSSTAPMQVAIGVHDAVLSRGVANGPYLMPTEAVQLVNIGAAPASGTRVDVVYEKQQDPTAGVPTPDGTTGPLYGVEAGVVGGGEPSIATIVGAKKLGTVAVSAGATRTTDGTVLITNTVEQTVARGGVIPTRSKADRDTITGYEGQPVWRTDLNLLEILSGTAGQLAAVYGPVKRIRTGGTATGALTNTIVGLHGAVTVTQPFGVGVPFQGTVRVYAYIEVAGGGTSEAQLGATGDPSGTVQQARYQNKAANQAGQTLVAEVDYDTGSADTYTFQPIVRAIGTIVNFADGRLTYSLVTAEPKAL